jgi:hypothetical protein
MLKVKVSTYLKKKKMLAKITRKLKNKQTDKEAGNLTFFAFMLKFSC